MKISSTVISICSALLLSVTGMAVIAGPSAGTKEVHSHVKVPHQYEGKKNPHWSHLPDIIEGGNIYKANCQICHGLQGKGDGPVSKNLDPKPADFNKSKMMAETRDDYLYWRVSDGGDMPPFNSSMPGFKDSLNNDQIWQVLAYAHAFSHISLLEHQAGEAIGGGHVEAGEDSGGGHVEAGEDSGGGHVEAVTPPE